MRKFVAISLRLSEEEAKIVEELKVKEITQVEIFRAGLILCQKAEYKTLKVPKEAIKKAKNIVK